ncbi:hypothetical protein Pmani_010790 [Petrolisthes manimaculis]|uniref:Uncharacterized protein n=1 Tax=Petrolisthes manimaculis TaxID=1843537 RepID=A0AAE1UGY8_9EUCA|nr:hypothetical protein Pmani_010790 [Petrolisthes manimaculis]
MGLKKRELGISYDGGDVGREGKKGGECCWWREERWRVLLVEGGKVESVAGGGRKGGVLLVEGGKVESVAGGERKGGECCWWREERWRVLMVEGGKVESVDGGGGM